MMNRQTNNFPPYKKPAVLETERLILRPWAESDADELFKYASSPEIGPATGWPAHTDIENSKEVIKTVLSAPETYALVLKDTVSPIGNISLMIGERSNIGIPPTEGEIGYWIGVPFWGRGLIPEAAQAMLKRAFSDLGLKKVWGGYFEGNAKSKRVLEKCGFSYKYTLKDMPWPLLHEIKTLHITCLTKDEWQQRKH